MQEPRLFHHEADCLGLVEAGSALGGRTGKRSVKQLFKYIVTSSQTFIISELILYVPVYKELTFLYFIITSSFFVVDCG